MSTRSLGVLKCSLPNLVELGKLKFIANCIASAIFAASPFGLDPTGRQTLLNVAGVLVKLGSIFATLLVQI